MTEAKYKLWLDTLEINFCLTIFPFFKAPYNCQGKSECKNSF
jgi:hypothetical protein